MNRLGYRLRCRCVCSHALEEIFCGGFCALSPGIIKPMLSVTYMLAMDTCGAEGGVALARVELGASTGTFEVIARRVLPGRETQERLMLAVEEVLAEGGIRVRDVGLLAVAHGPGSFTGVRIGVAAVKGMAEALGVPVVAVSRLRMVAERAAGLPEATIAAWLDAGRGDVYVGVYRNGICVQETMLAREQARQVDGEVAVGEEGLRGEGRWVGVPVVDDLVRIAVREAQAGRFADVLTLDANYLRIPDAELALKARQCV